MINQNKVNSIRDLATNDILRSVYGASPPKNYVRKEEPIPETQEEKETQDINLVESIENHLKIRKNLEILKKK